ncbi:hypothetical protein F5Y06DRAFT_80614 [Hypoxylon sp. FL0890]|nr:hypothetical protein F5Y06DRAFT_80614 [Hypoxylon sp. FL0890]
MPESLAIDLQRNVTPEMAPLLPIQTVPPKDTTGLPFGKLRSGVDVCKHRDLQANIREAIRARSRCPSSLQIEAPASSETSSLIRRHTPLLSPGVVLTPVDETCYGRLVVPSRRYIHLKQRFALRGCTTAREESWLPLLGRARNHPDSLPKESTGRTVFLPSVNVHQQESNPSRYAGDDELTEVVYLSENRQSRIPSLSEKPLFVVM